MDGAQTDREAALHAPESGGARIGTGSGAVAVEQLSKLRFRGSGRGANQSVGRGQAKNRDASGLSPHLYKERKGGPATGLYFGGRFRGCALRQSWQFPPKPGPDIERGSI